MVFINTQFLVVQPKEKHLSPALKKRLEGRPKMNYSSKQLKVLCDVSFLFFVKYYITKLSYHDSIFEMAINKRKKYFFRFIKSKILSYFM